MIRILLNSVCATFAMGTMSLVAGCAPDQTVKFQTQAEFPGSGRFSVTVANGVQEIPPSGPVVTVGDPSHPDTLGQQLAEAYNRGARRIAIRAGVYRFSLAGHPIVDLSHWQNAQITGHNATLISAETRWGDELIHMQSCANVRIEDLTLSQTWQTALQGKVVELLPGSREMTECVWQPDQGYPSPAVGATHFNKGPNVVDAQSRQLKLGCGDQWDATLSPGGAGRYRVSFRRKVNLAVGDWLVSRGDAAPCKVHLVGCHGCSLSNLTLLRNAFGSIMENDGGGNSYFDCHWQLGPKPPDASEKPLVSCSVDGFHSVGCYPGPDLENCEFTGVLLDDCITIHGVLQPVKSSSPGSLVIEKGPLTFKPGQPIRIGAAGFIENAFVKAVSENGDGSVSVRLDRNLDIPAGAMVGNPLLNGQSFKVLNCKIGGTRSRGILIKADGGLIQGNAISNCGLSAISVGPEYSWKEGDYVQDLSIKDNRISRNGFAAANSAAIFVHGEGARGNHNLTIEYNSFNSNFGGDIDLQWLTGGEISNNSFEAATEGSPFGRPRAIVVEHASELQILKNVYKDATGYRAPLVQTGSDVRGVRSDSPG